MMRIPSQAEPEKAMKIRVAIELLRTKEFGEILGFMLGDGTMNPQGNRAGMANAEIFCIEKMLRNLENIYGVSREGFYYHVTAPFDSDLESTSKFWQYNLRLKKEVKVYRDKRKKTKKRFGIMSVWINNTDICQSIRANLSEFLHKNEPERELALGFLRGFFAAEGAVIPGKERREVPNSIQFPQKGNDIPQLIKKLLDRLGIDGRVVLKQKKADYYCVNITAQENFRKFIELGLADLHPEKKEKIAIGLKSYIKPQSRRQVTSLKLLSILAERMMNRYDIYDRMGRTKQHINEMLYGRKKSFLLRNGFIKKINLDGHILWKITLAGREFLQKR